jgi:predicted ATPase
VARNGYGVAGFLADLKDNDPKGFSQIEAYLRKLRPETESLSIWSAGSEVVWGVRDKGNDWKFPAVHLSWGDRQLVGLLCVLFSARPDSTIAIEEIDRGFHPSRYSDVIDLLSEAAYDGLMGHGKTQIIVTTHSPSMVNKLGDLTGSVRLVTRATGGGTMVRPLERVLKDKLGTDRPDQPLGEIWEMGLLEETIHEAMI